MLTRQETDSPVLEVLSGAVDLAHALAMLVWGAGLPLLFWHRWTRLSQAYAVYSLLFVATSVLSQLVLGECFLTRVSRELADAGTNTDLRYTMSFTLQLVESIAGLRPSERTAVRLWELAIFVTSVGLLLYGTRRPRAAGGPRRNAQPAPKNPRIIRERLS